MVDFTDRDTERWMVFAERADPRNRNPGEARPLSWPERYLRDEDERRALKLWVWCQANGYAFRPLCDRRGFSHTTWLRRKNTAVARITAALNVEESLKNSVHAHAAAG